MDLNETDLFQMCYVPKKLLEQFVSMLPGVSSERYAKTLLKKGFLSAQKENRLKIKNNAMFFPIGRDDKDGNELFLLCEPNEAKQEIPRPWLAVYVGSESESRIPNEAAIDFPDGITKNTDTFLIDDKTESDEFESLDSSSIGFHKGILSPLSGSSSKVTDSAVLIDAVQSDKASSEDTDPEAGYQDEAGLFPDSFDEDYIGTVWALDPKDSVQTIDIPDNDDDNLSINDESKNFHSEVVRDIRDFCYVPQMVISKSIVSYTPARDTSSAWRLLQSAFKNAQQNNTLEIYDDLNAVIFPLGRSDRSNRPIYVLCKPNRNIGKQRWVISYVGPDPTLGFVRLPLSEHSNEEDVDLLNKPDNSQSETSVLSSDIDALEPDSDIDAESASNVKVGKPDSMDSDADADMENDHLLPPSPDESMEETGEATVAHQEAALNGSPFDTEEQLIEEDSFTASDDEAKANENDLSSFGFAPQNTLNTLISHYSMGNESAAWSLLNSAFHSANKSGELEIYDDLNVSVFPLGRNDSAGKPIYVLCRPNANTGVNPAPWALTYIGSNPMIGSTRLPLSRALDESDVVKPVDEEIDIGENTEGPSESLPETSPENEPMSKNEPVLVEKAESESMNLFESVRKFCGLRKEALDSLKCLFPSTVFSKEDAWQQLQFPFMKAQEEGTLELWEACAAFPAGRLDDMGRPIYIFCRRNNLRNQQPWMAMYAGAVLRDDAGCPYPASGNVTSSVPTATVNAQTLKKSRTKVFPGRTLESWAYMGKWDETLDALAELAQPEQWDFEGSAYCSKFILLQYLRYTFYRLDREKKVMQKLDDKGNGIFAAFNTGLVTRTYDDIYACFEPSKDGYSSPWRLRSFCIAGVDDGKVLLQHFQNPPEAARYYKSHSDLIYDVDLQLYTDYSHIILEHPERLPLEFIRYECNNTTTSRLVDEINVADDALVKERRYRELSDFLKNSPQLYNRLRNRMKDAIDLAVKRTRWNYKTAVPMYHPARDSMSLMLPLCLLDDETADVALVVQRNTVGNYQGQTILSLPMAYLDARQICRPDSDWLNPNRITPDNIDEEIEELQD